MYPLQKLSKAVLACVWLICVATTVAHTQIISKAHQQKKFINPTGIYTLQGKQKGDETYGYFGHVYVQYSAPQKIIVKFYICKGYMSYSSGRFYDTLLYQNNTAVYGPTENDTTCKIIFTFYPNRVVVDEQTADFNNGCDFGHGVVANAIFRKKTSKSPNPKEMNLY